MSSASVFDPSEVDTTRCPLCNKVNACLPAMGNCSDNCWCMTANIPRELLKQIPEEKRNLACVCKACIENFQKKG